MHGLRHKMWFSIGLFGTLCVLILLCTWLSTPAASAQASPDSACRGCHGDNQRTLELPSGEELPLLVHLAEFDSSPHGMMPDGTCRSCHTNSTKYRYPHDELPISVTTLAEYRAASSQVCTDCHYGHEPFHSELPEEVTGPTCVDCHGDHAIASFETIPESMPNQCLTCHTDETSTWAQSYFPQREGFGTGAAGYAGSARCLGCHEDLYLGWQDTHHALSIQNANINPEAVEGDFSDRTSRPTLWPCRSRLYHRRNTSTEVHHSHGRRWFLRPACSMEEVQQRVGSLSY